MYLNKFVNLSLFSMEFHMKELQAGKKKESNMIELLFASILNNF